MFQSFNALKQIIYSLFPYDVTENMQLYNFNTMFPSVTKQDVRDKTKQKTWDDRFIKSSIPDYSPLRDKHTKAYRKSLNKQKDIKEEGGKREGKKTYFQKRMQLMDELVAMHRPHEKMLEEYEQLAGKHKLPNFYIYYSLLPLLNPTASVPQYLFNEKKLMKEQATHYHRISTAVKAREQCLQRLRGTLAQLREERLQQRKGQLKQEVGHYRFLTQNVIDEIKRWRDTLGLKDESAFYYNDNQENYLIRLLNDNHFFFNSKLALALSFADKNDPFILAPLKRAEGKEASLFLEILHLDKDASHYQKYMEYLASQKAHELSLHPAHPQQQIIKHPSQKVYRSQPRHQRQQATIGALKEEVDEEAKKLETLKMREERLKKNEQRIKSIKSIYQTYSRKAEERHYRSERKLPETDVQDRKGKKRIEIKPKEEPKEAEFENMVRARVEAQKEREKVKTPIRLNTGRSASKGKSEDRMIESLRDIQSTLRNKLQVIQQEEIVASTLPPARRRNNDEIIKQLKQEILGKIEKEAQQKQRVRKLKRQQEEKMLEQVKAKLKRQMEEKLEMKKKEKLLERQELQRKLKQEEERLNGQKQLELQLQLKLNKEKELRELEKIRRESLQREKKYREELEKEQALRKATEEDAERERREKERLAEQLKKRQIREQIEQQLRVEVKSTARDNPYEAIQLRTAKEAELSKELQSLKMRQGLQLEQLKRENQLRQRMLRLKREEEELKRKQIEQLMREAVQSQKTQLAEQGAKRRIQLQQTMRANVKEKLLEEYRTQKEAQVEEIRLQRQHQLQEEVYRQKIREKIEREMRVEAIQRTRQQLEQRQGKKKEIRSKLEQVKAHFDRDVGAGLDKSKIEHQVKREVVERVIFDKQAEREAAKHDLRMQFEKELFTSAVPQIYAPSNTFQVKDINYFQGDSHLISKLNETRPTNQKPAIVESPSKPKQLIDTMTLQQLQVYEKQKEKVSEMKEERIVQAARSIQQEEGFEQVSLPRREETAFQIKPVIQSSPSKKKGQAKLKKEQTKQKSKRKKKAREESEQEDSEDRSPKKQRKKRHYYDSEQDSQDADKRKKAKKHRKNSSQSEAPSSGEKQKEKSPKKTQIQQDIRASEEQKRSSPIKKQPSERMQKQQSEKGVVHFDAEKSKLTPNPVDQVSFKPQKVPNNSEKFKMTLQAIPEAEFDQYLQVHLSRVPQEQLAVQSQSREELYRKLIGELTFCLLIGQLEGRVVGLALAYHDRARQDVRKFTIIHLATYKNEDLRDFVLSTTNYIFRKDPTDQIEMHYRFNQTDPAQAAFSTDFNKWFDKYGSVFQKKVEEGVFQRKYLLKRQFNQKCEVVLGGVNKNTFRNLFTVYCGVLMSDTDMLQFKQQLVDTLAPQNQICYSIMVSELFRTYLSPDEAEALKVKVKEFVKLKEMLVLVVMMQKKKLKLDQLKLYEYKTLIELNMRLMSQGKEIIRYCKDGSGELNRLYYAELSHAFNLPFHFQTTSLPVESRENEVRQISYFRLSCLPPFKLHIIKSSLYNAEMNILPTENSKYKLFVLSAQEYNQLKEASHLDLFMYIRLFLKNVKAHNVAVWKYVWLPEMTDRAAWNLREFRSFLNKDFYTHDSINITYRQFLPGALIIEPEHRDLVITPPFIVGVMSMSLEQVSEGSPIYARMIELDALKTLEVETTPAA